MLHNFLNLERATCIHLLKIAGDSNFNLLFGKTTSILLNLIPVYGNISLPDVINSLPKL